MKDKDIDKLLKEWDRQSAHGVKSGEDLKKNVLAKIKAGVDVEEKPVLQFKPALKIAFGAAAALVVAVAVFLAVPENGSGNSQLTEKGPEALCAEDLAELRIVVNEIQHLFPEGIRWISKVNDKLEIETAAGDKFKPSPEKMLIRYVVMKKDNDRWRKVHHADIVTSAGESIRLVTENTNGYIWTYQADKDVFAVDSKLKLKLNGNTFDISYSGGLETRTVETVKTLKSNGETFRILQTVLRI